MCKLFASLYLCFPNFSRNVSEGTRSLIPKIENLYVDAFLDCTIWHDASFRNMYSNISLMFAFNSVFLKKGTYGLQVS